MTKKKEGTDGTNSGGADPKPPEDQETESTDPGAPGTDDGPGAGDPGSDDGKIEFTPEQQARIDQIITSRLARAKDTWEREQKDAAEKAKQDAARARLKEQEQFKELASELEGRVAELEPLEAQIEQYRTAIDEILQSELQALGDKAKTAVENLPGQPDALAQLQWLRANRTLFATEDGNTGGGTPRPRGPGQRTPSTRPSVPKPSLRV